MRGLRGYAALCMTVVCEMLLVAATFGSTLCVFITRAFVVLVRAETPSCPDNMNFCLSRGKLASTDMSTHRHNDTHAHTHHAHTPNRCSAWRTDAGHLWRVWR